MPPYCYQEEAVCGSCAHFRRPYIKTGNHYHPITYGHCVYPRLKKRTLSETCPHWTPKS